jgi:tryptophan-rich sensory protein
MKLYFMILGLVVGTCSLGARKFAPEAQGLHDSTERSVPVPSLVTLGCNTNLAAWILGLVAVGMGIGRATQPAVESWYAGLNLPPLTPPNYVFPLAWTLLYALLGVSGWSLWHSRSSKILKAVYLVQLLLNFSWTPLFFGAQMTGAALAVLVCMDIAVGAMLYLSYSENLLVALCNVPYFLWITFATYLNLYIWLYN